MHPPSFFRPQIPSDVLIAVLEYLYKIAPTTLRGLRCVSKQFDALVIPYAYRHVVLNDRILSSISGRNGCIVIDESHPTWIEWQGLRDMRQYTRNVSIDRNLSQWATWYLLRSLSRLECVTWSYWGGFYFRPNPYDGPIALQDAIHSRWPNVQFLVEDVNVQVRAPIDVDCIPRSNMISCKTETRAGCYFDATTLRELLLTRPQLPQLETLHLICGDGYEGIADTLLFPDDRLPPIKELVLQGYHWVHSPYAAVTFWNWTGMTSLELRKVNIASFLRTVTPEHLVQLRSFTTDGYCSRREEYYASRLMCTLVSKIEALEKLALVCRFETPGLIAAVTKHGSSLRSLILRDYNGSNARWLNMRSFLSQDDIWAIRSACPNLMELETNIEIQLPANFVFVGPLTRYRNLRRLTLFTCMPEPFPGAEDCETLLQKTRTAARAWIVGLVGLKHGAIFEKVIMNIGVEKVAMDDQVRASWGAFVNYRFEGEKDENGLVVGEHIVEEG